MKKDEATVRVVIEVILPSGSVHRKYSTSFIIRNLSLAQDLAVRILEKIMEFKKRLEQL